MAKIPSLALLSVSTGPKSVASLNAMILGQSFTSIPREELDELTRDGFCSMSKSKGLAALVNRKKRAENEAEIAGIEHDTDEDLAGLSPRQKELLNARRVLRQAGWATVFYLITCDILGPFNAPYALASMGVVPGALLYLLFGMCVSLPPRDVDVSRDPDTPRTASPLSLDTSCAKW